MSASTSSPPLRLFPVFIAPLVWALHFLATYITVAAFCEKLGSRSIDLARGLVLVYTVAALLPIVALGWRYRRVWRSPGPNASERPPAHAFLGRLGFLLALLSAVAVLFVVQPAFYIGSCR